MHSDHADAAPLNVPPDLLAELERRGKGGGHDFHVEGWKPSVFERFVMKLTGRK